MELMGLMRSREHLEFRGGVFAVWRVCRLENVHMFWVWGP